MGVGRPQHLDCDSTCIIQSVQIWVAICRNHLGILVSSTLKARSYTDRACAFAESILSSIRRSFSRLPLDTFKLLYVLYVRSRLKYSGPASFPCTGEEVVKLERAHRTATGMAVGPMDPWRPNLHQSYYLWRLVSQPAGQP